jgi:hypothetical protein
VQERPHAKFLARSGRGTLRQIIAGPATGKWPPLARRYRDESGTGLNTIVRQYGLALTVLFHRVGFCRCGRIFPFAGCDPAGPGPSRSSLKGLKFKA